MRLRRCLWPLAGLAAACGAGTAQASCTIGVSILSGCSATVSATPVAFGNYNPALVSATDTSGTLTVTANFPGVASLFVTLSYSISLDGGSSGNVTNRQMKFGTKALAYNLYTDSPPSTVWGTNTVSDSQTALVTLLGAQSSKQYTVYGRIPAQQYMAAGTYSDTITVTVNY